MCGERAYGATDGPVALHAGVRRALPPVFAGAAAGALLYAGDVDEDASRRGGCVHDAEPLYGRAVLRLGVEAEKFVYVTNGQTLRRGQVSRGAAPKRRNRFGFFGQLVDAKGVHVILEAVSLLRAEGFTDFQVEINGDNIQFASPKRRAEFEAFFAEELKRPAAERNVVFNGSYHHDQMASRMGRIDWCIVPSVWWEIFCLVISEAWSFGRPVIASNVGGPAERITDGVDGLLFEMGDARALAETMRRACTEEGLWEHLAGGISAPSGRDVMVEGFLRVYRGGRCVWRWSRGVVVVYKSLVL